MRVALIAPPWLPVPPPAYGGTEAVVDRLARGLLAAGHEVCLFTTGDSTCPVPRAWSLPSSAVAKMGDSVTELRHLVHAYEAVGDFDIVHDHTVLGPTYASTLGDLPVVTTNHGPFNEDLKVIYASIAARVPIIAISHDQARTAGAIPIAAVIHHGVEPERFPVGQGDGGYVCFLGRMNQTKGVREAGLAARETGVPLLIAAKNREPLEQQYFETQVRPLLGAGVEYLGELSGQDKLDLLGGARALLNPIQWHEPFGLVMIEALACGTPVLAFPNGAVPEIVDHGKTGYLCAGHAELVEAIDQIDALDRAACRAAVEERFSNTRVVRDHLELYAAVLQRRKATAKGTIVLDAYDATRPGYGVRHLQAAPGSG
jgi:glycosyltransferase involved in cell wall biosynthesis